MRNYKQEKAYGLEGYTGVNVLNDVKRLKLFITSLTIA